MTMKNNKHILQDMINEAIEYGDTGGRVCQEINYYG